MTPLTRLAHLATSGDRDAVRPLLRALVRARPDLVCALLVVHACWDGAVRWEWVASSDPFELGVDEAYIHAGIFAVPSDYFAHGDGDRARDELERLAAARMHAARRLTYQVVEDDPLLRWYRDRVMSRIETPPDGRRAVMHSYRAQGRGIEGERARTIIEDDPLVEWAMLRLPDPPA